MLDGIGLILTDGIKEVARKGISILEKATKMNGFKIELKRKITKNAIIL